MKMNKKLTVAAILVAGIFTTGYGAHNSANANEGLGAILGGVVGGVVGNQFGKGGGKTAATVVGSMIGVVTGANVGRSMDRSSSSPVYTTAPPTGHNHASNPCDVYMNAGERSFCLRGLEERAAAEQRVREREAYERGRNGSTGGGHSHNNSGWKGTNSFDFVFVWDERRRYKKRCGYHNNRCYKKSRRHYSNRRCGIGYKMRRNHDGLVGCYPKRR